ncbi:hypothetical protein Q1695_004680 [Nippostrongylus brasiliensis]|nr:hypothetical protein Q1695_004680 [Nippostrongylus brasiliensis]
MHSPDDRVEHHSHPSHHGGSGELRWRKIDSAPAIRQYLKTLQMEISCSPERLVSFVANDVKLASSVAQHFGNPTLADRLDVEAQRLEFGIGGIDSRTGNSRNTGC